MEYKTGFDRGAIIDSILANTILTTPVQSKTDFMYIVGDNEVFITIQCDKHGNEISAFCIRHLKNTNGCTSKSTQEKTKYIKITNPKIAKFINNACKLRLKGQAKEQAKIDRFNQRFK